MCEEGGGPKGQRMQTKSSLFGCSAPPQKSLEKKYTLGPNNNNNTSGIHKAPFPKVTKHLEHDTKQTKCTRKH